MPMTGKPMSEKTLRMTDFSYSPRGNKLSRIASRIGSRTAHYDEISQASSIDSIVRSSQGKNFQGFNANPVRGRIMQAIATATGATVFVETGSGKAATTLSAHGLMRLPVWSCEQNFVNYLICRCLSAGIKEIDIRKGQSREFLREVVDRLKRESSELPFFFLDAHGGHDGTGETGDSCPLLTEIATVCALPRFVAVIDDVALPGFEGGTYGKIQLDLPFLRPALMANSITDCWIPAYQASSDLGWPSGYCIFSRGIEFELAANAQEFPFNLLKRERFTHGM